MKACTPVAVLGGAILCVSLLSCGPQGCPGRDAIARRLESLESLAGSDSSRLPWTKVRASIERHLDKPYKYGGIGPKSFDCSGFAWRVMTDCGIRINRTSARKYHQSLPFCAPGEEWEAGNLVFFDGDSHMGILGDDGDFYHASKSYGRTTRSDLSSDWMDRRRMLKGDEGTRAMPSSTP